MFRKLKSVVVFLKIIVSFVLTRPFGKHQFLLSTMVFHWFFMLFFFVLRASIDNRQLFASEEGPVQNHHFCGCPELLNDKRK